MAITDRNTSEIEVMNAAREALESGTGAVLATVVDVEGNAYRRPGAKMLVTADGDGAGSVTAGCLENDVVRIAADIRETGRPRVETFDLRDGDVWGSGLGCNGAITVLFEPVDRSYEPALTAFESGPELAVLTVLRSDEAALSSGDRAYWADGFRAPEETAAALSEAIDTSDNRLANVAATATESGSTATLELRGADGEGTTRLFVEGVAPPADLVAFGTGHDVAPVVEFGTRADFRSTVVGFRGGEAVDSRFPDAADVVSTSPSDVRTAVDFDDSTYAVVMTHNYVDDRIVLEELLETPVPYIGVMGPAERFERLVDDIEADGRNLDQSDFERVYAPVGLDLGGGSPQQIAQSIVAEASVVRNDRPLRHLRNKAGEIHADGKS